MNTSNLPFPPSEKSDEQPKFDMTAEEAKRLEKCFKDPKFRDLLADYVEEISNPTTRMAYEEYLRQVESESGGPPNKKLVKPAPAFCVKARYAPQDGVDDDDSTNSSQPIREVDGDEDDQSDEMKSNSENVPTNSSGKVFINVCASNMVDGAKLGPINLKKRPIDSTGDERSGIAWQIPYLLNHPRWDHDNQGNWAEVFDIAFSFETITTSLKDRRFKSTVIQTALEAVEEQTRRKFDRSQCRIMKNMKSKGKPAMMSVDVSSPNKVLSKRAFAKPSKSCCSSTTHESDHSEHDHNHEEQQPSSSSKKRKGRTTNRKKRGKNKRNRKGKARVERNDDSSVEKVANPSAQPSPEGQQAPSPKLVEMVSAEEVAELTEGQSSHTGGRTKPKHKVVERGEMDLSQFWTDDRLSICDANSFFRRPKFLIVTVFLPRVSDLSMMELNIDDKDQVFCLECGNICLIEINLPYKIIANESKAKWIGDRHELEVTIPVSRPSDEEMAELRERMIAIQTRRAEHDEQPSCLEEVGAGLEDDEAVETDTTVEATQEENVAYRSPPKETPDQHAVDMDAVWAALPERKDVPFDMRENVEKIVLMYRISQIDERSLQIEFCVDKLLVTFCTTSFRYRKEFMLGGRIVPNECSFDLNSRNLMVLLVKECRGEKWTGLEIVVDHDQDERSDVVATVESGVESSESEATARVDEPEKETGRLAAVMKSVMETSNILDLE